MAELMVHRESRLDGALLVAVARPDPKTVTFSYVTQNAAWFAPEDPAAGPDGWLRGICDVTGDGILRFADRTAAADAYERMSRWCEHNTSLTIASLLDEQATVLLDRATGDSVAVKMSDDALDASR